MPNSHLAYDPNHPAFAGVAPEALPNLILELAESVFFRGLTDAIFKVTGIKSDDVDMEIRQFGPRITGPGGELLPVNIYVRALAKEKWSGQYQLDDGSFVSKAEAVAKIACENIALSLMMNPTFSELGFDLKLENAAGAYDTGDRARARMKTQG